MENKKDFSSKILNAIKTEKIKPKPRWEFLLKDYFILFAGILSILVGGLAVAVIIFMVINNNWDLLPYFNRTQMGHFFISLPYYWLLFLSIFILIAYFNLKHTKNGYRYSLQKVTLVSVGASIVLGVLFYGIGFGRAIDNAFSKKVPIYRNIAHKIPKEFVKPDSGILIGEIIEINDNDTFIILDNKNNRWEIRLDNLKQKCDPIIKLGYRMVVIGESIEENIFSALGLKPWDREDTLERIKECGELFHEDMMNIREMMIRDGFRPGMGPGMMQKELMKEVKENY